MQWRNEKEDQGKLSWTLCNYGTEAMAQEADLTIKQYWNQIIKACYLDHEDPVQEWRKTEKFITKTAKKLNALNIVSVHVEGSDIDLHVTFPKEHKWVGGGGANIPSFEIFTTPHWEYTEGWIRFNQPLYRYGNKISGIELQFKRGRVVKASAAENEQVLLDMIAQKNADKLGEFSLTDKRLSRITKPMADTLYDENMGGSQGNMHIALGLALRCCYSGDPSKVSESQWMEMGYNDSSVHTDIISTTKRKVTATLANGKQQVIYQNGEFVL